MQKPQHKTELPKNLSPAQPALPQAVRQAMHSDNPLQDPVAAQYIPQLAEDLHHPLQQDDPIGDAAHSPVKGIIHRYPSRALLKATHVCPVYCRYCFRKEMVGPQHNDHALNKAELERALDYIATTPSLSEIILTGGDPLMLAPAKLLMIMQRLEAMDHIKFIRIHTRTPIARPELVTEKMLQAFAAAKKQIYMALHVNHAQEITPPVDAAMKALRQANIVLLSQSVLLKNINDSAEMLSNLYETLVAQGVKPYMLHHPDQANGTQHFAVTIKRGMEIMRQLRGQYSGLCQPDYMLDIPGGYGKIPVTGDYIRALDGAGLYEVTDYQGQKHIYQDIAETPTAACKEEKL